MTNKKPIQVIVLIFAALLFPLELFSQDLVSAQNLLNRGTAYYNSQKYDTAINFFLKALEEYESVSDEVYLSTGYKREDYTAGVFSYLGECYRNQKLYSEALPWYDRAESYYRSKGDEFNASVFLGTKGTCYLGLKQYEKAESAIKSALQTAGEYDQTFYEALWYGNLGELYVNSGKYREAEENCRRGIKLAQQVGDSYLTYICITNLGQALYMLDEYKEAEENYKKSWRWAEENTYTEGQADIAENYGAMLTNQARYEEALSVYKTGYSYFESCEDFRKLAAFQNMIGYVYEKKDEYKTALEWFEGALKLGREYELNEEISSAYNNMGALYNHWGDLVKAETYFKKALEIDLERNDKRGIIILQTNIASIYHTWGYYTEAMDLYQESLKSAIENEFTYEIPGLMGKQALLLIDWGDYAKAEILLNKALRFAEQNGVQESVSNIYSYIGIMYNRSGNFDKAELYYKKAIALDEASGRKIQTAVLKLNLATLLHENRKYKEAMDGYLEAKALFEENGLKEYQASCINNIATLYYDKKEFEQALVYYRLALKLAEEVGNAAIIISIYQSMGNIYLQWDDYDNAEALFRKNLEHVIQMQKTAPPEQKRDLKLANITSYQSLMMCYARKGDVNAALAMFEYYTAGALSEQIQKDAKVLQQIREKQQEQAKRNNGTVLREPGNTLLIYAGFNLDEGIIFQHTKDDLYITTVRKYMISEQIEEKIGNSVDQVFLQNPDLARLLVQTTAKESVDRRFDQFVLYYRYLLSRPFLSRVQKEHMEFLSRKFYELFIENQLESMEETKSLTIIREGVLAYLPFETLMDADGHYLIERFSINYTLSKTTEEYLKGRNHNSSAGNILAFGGAEYKQGRNSERGNQNALTAEQLQALANSFYTLIGTDSPENNSAEDVTRSDKLRSFYRKLNYYSWDNLPGTLAEVESIRNLMPGSTVFTGKAVKEETVFELQKKDKLKNFRIIHFATHGIIIPEIPELSALVLSTEGENSNNDGYLTALEISGLNLEADFVNLSACETGLGRVYPGEGLVGLIHSFFVAGANGVCASLWNVSDKSTAEFMIGLYSKVIKEKMSYSEAINAMKREFIKSEKYSLPYYWAPFLYYGN